MKSEQEIMERINDLKLKRKELSARYRKESTYSMEDYCSDANEIDIGVQALLWVLES